MKHFFQENNLSDLCLRKNYTFGMRRAYILLSLTKGKKKKKIVLNHYNNNHMNNNNS